MNKVFCNLNTVCARALLQQISPPFLGCFGSFECKNFQVLNILKCDM